MAEQIYFVDEADFPTGETAEKYAAHHADTKLHAAFSCYIFNEEGQILATQRADSKKVWPGVWTNSCCGHPAPGENREDAIIRRVAYELGMRIKNIQLIVPDYIYKTPPYNGVVEHEYCPVFIARADSAVNPNPDEVRDYKWLPWEQYVEILKNDPDDYTPYAKAIPERITDEMPKWSWWCKDQLKQIKNRKEMKMFLKQITS